MISKVELIQYSMNIYADRTKFFDLQESLESLGVPVLKHGNEMSYVKVLHDKPVEFNFSGLVVDGKLPVKVDGITTHLGILSTFEHEDPDKRTPRLITGYKISEPESLIEAYNNRFYCQHCGAQYNKDPLLGNMVHVLSGKVADSIGGSHWCCDCIESETLSEKDAQATRLVPMNLKALDTLPTIDSDHIKQVMKANAEERVSRTFCGQSIAENLQAWDEVKKLSAVMLWCTGAGMSHTLIEKTQRGTWLFFKACPLTDAMCEEMHIRLQKFPFEYELALQNERIKKDPRYETASQESMLEPPTT